MNLLDQTIGNIACEIPGATRLFHQHKLDFCCGGGKSLREAAEKRGVDMETLIEELERLSEKPNHGRNWKETPPPELIEYILHLFHERHREQLPELIRLAQRVEHVHGERPACPVGLADLLTTIHQEMESHMMKEEQILFPMIIRGYYSLTPSPIAVMRFEHDQHGESLARMEQLTNDITPPEHACNTWRALYLGLAQLREDLMQHIHLENNVLFLNAEKEAAKPLPVCGCGN